MSQSPAAEFQPSTEPFPADVFTADSSTVSESYGALMGRMCARGYSEDQVLEFIGHEEPSAEVVLDPAAEAMVTIQDMLDNFESFEKLELEDLVAQMERLGGGDEV